MRLLSSLDRYVATVRDDVLYLHQVTSASIDVALAGGRLRARAATDYPWEGVLRLEVLEAPVQPFGIAIRVPSWAETSRISGGGEQRPLAAGPDGYDVVVRTWSPGDVLEVEFELAPRLTYPDPHIDALRGTVAVERGPLVYCLEQVDQPPGVDVESVVVGTDAGKLTQETADLPGIGRTVVVRMPARVLPRSTIGALPYSPRPFAPVDPAAPGAEAVAVPYFQWDNRDGGAMRVWIPVAAMDQF
jgi:DUF1680 family protein